MTPEVLPDLLRARAGEAPDAVALRVGDTEALTYGDWEARSNAVARALVERDVHAGDRVALAFPNERWADYAACYLGVLKGAAVAVPLGPRFSGAELAAAVDHAGATLVVRPHDDLEAGQPTEPFQAPVSPDDLAEILYTSGTTGRPKGVACTHGNLMAHDVPGDAVAPDTPVSFLHAFPIGTQAGQEALRVPLRVAGRVAVALPAFDPEAACKLVEHHRVVRLQLVPAMAQLLVASGAARSHDLSSVRRVILSSAPAAPAVFARLADVFPQASLWNAYALTEAGAARTLMEWDPTRPTAVGRPVGETEVRIVDGEIWLRRRGSPTRSYYADPVATAATFAGGWVRTGDLGYVDADGYLHLTDRKKDVVITGGSNVSSVEVEHALFEHPAVVEAAVVGVPHPVLGEVVAAAVVVRSPTSIRELQDVVRRHLAEHKVPHRIAVVDRLPRNPSGKVVKGDVRALFTDHASAATAPASARTATEAVVASIWSAVLGRTDVGIDDDFFAVGGHSLAAAQVAARLGDAFAVAIPVTAVFESPTVAELARTVDEAAAMAR